MPGCAGGPVWEVPDCPVLSDRGAALRAALDALGAFETARTEALDRIAAARALDRIATG